ncbi:SHOCT domain-containing protein [Mycetocola zhujimingii]|uniref:SHOCT domain-containing protein n=1 Tax=Mycetocola zhujimingii TaxID=2079792 RepID=UPI000D39CC0E|nr:SHOCT domain-containing protein [Mycetocola zhujimingii]AWB87746.1 hypothetical protein C3E77_14825 [Mycetocola zhujimingii]
MGPQFDFFPIIFGIVAAIIVIAVILIVVMSVKNARKVKDAGHDPLTLHADLANRVLDSDVMRPAQSTEQRLAKLDELHARNVISADEHASARAEIIRGN